MQRLLLRRARVDFGEEIVLLVLVSVRAILSDEPKDQKANENTQDEQASDQVGKVRDE